MYQSTVSLRVRYADTDQMGYVYYGRYAEYFEVARVEALRKLGVSYRDLEAEGVLMPVADYAVKYLKPARYDEELTIQITINQMPQARIRFDYKIYNHTGECITEAHTTLVFILAAEQKITRIPKVLQQALMPYFS